MDGKSRTVQSTQTAGTSAQIPSALADPAPTPDLPVINPALEINLPSFKYFTQVVQPLVFDDSLSLYEVTQKLSAYLNANIEQVNALTGGVKDFMESMVKWGQEINAQWVAYQEALNKEWTDFQGEMNESYNNLVNQWNAYQTDLNNQWSAYKTQVNAEMAALQGEWSTYKAGMEDDWSQFQLHYEQLWEQYKESIDSTIESQVNTWMVTNANTTITNWLDMQSIPDWQQISVLTAPFADENITVDNSVVSLFMYSEKLHMLIISVICQARTTNYAPQTKYNYGFDFTGNFPSEINNSYNFACEGQSYTYTNYNYEIIGRDVVKMIPRDNGIAIFSLMSSADDTSKTLMGLFELHAVVITKPYIS